MGTDNDFIRFMAQDRQLVTANRPIRLRLARLDGVADDMLLPQNVFVSEAMCGGLECRVLCVATCATVPLKELIALPAAVDFVTDRGELRSVCGIVAAAGAGGSDGAIATYQLVLRDAMAIMEKRINTRVFRNMNEFEVVEVILAEWRHDNAVLARCFERETDELFHLRASPPREFIMQHNESDAAFVRRLLKRSGIGWYFRAGRSRSTTANPHHDAIPAHTMLMFNNSNSLRQNPLVVRFHREHATEQSDTITSWSAVRSLQAGSVSRHSWDYRNPLGTHFMTMDVRGAANQGESGNELAASLNDYQVQMPHAGNDNEDLYRLGQLRMQRHDYETKCFHAEGGSRDLPLGGCFSLSGHPEIDTHPAAERDFIVTALQITAQNNLPKALAARAERLFARNRWMQGGAAGQPFQRELAEAVDGGPVRFHIQFTAVRCGIAIVPAYDARSDLPPTSLQSALVVGPAGEEVHCDQLGRAKIRFHGVRAQDQRHANGAGASGTEADSAWVRVASHWAGNGPGSLNQCGGIFLPRVGTEVLVDFLGGDPDKPVIVGQLYNQNGQPPALSSLGELPGNRYLSGIKSREVRGGRANQLRFDDCPGQISAQLASEHGASQLNLGWLTQPKSEGYGAPRGEGFELASHESGCLRSAKSLLISAWGRRGAAGKQLSNEEHVALLKDCLELCQSLGQYAAEHLALAVDCKPQAQLKDDVAAAGAGSNTDPKGQGGKPTLSVTAPDGLALSTPKTIVSYAGMNVDTAAQQHMQLSCGQRFNLNAGKGISLFSHMDGITQIAHKGTFTMQSQHGDLQVDSARDIKITAAGRLTIMAQEIVFINTSGAYVTLKGGGPEVGGPGPLSVKTDGHHWDGPASAAAEMPKFSEGDLGRTPRLLRATDGKPVEGMQLHVARDGAGPVTGRSDRDGKGAPILSDSLQRIKAYFFQQR